MKKTILTAVVAFSSLTLFAQNELDVYKMSRNDLTGTARSTAMGGAFGALGGDISGVAINPAGIGVYRGSEFVTTLNFRNNDVKTSVPNGYNMKDNKFNVNFDNLGFVASMAVDNDQVPRINFGFAYNRLKSFDRKYTMDAGTQPYSLTDYIAAKSYGQSLSDLQNSINSDGSFNQSTNANWLSALGYQGYLINYNGIDAKNNTVYSPVNAGENTYPYLDVEEKGGVDRYDFTAGTTIADKLSLGLTLSVTDIDYTMYSGYTEGFLQGTNNGFNLQNYLNTEGNGFQFNLGLIYKPINEIRIGLAYQSPTWYNMTDHYDASLDYNTSAYFANPKDYTQGSTIYTGLAYTDYKMRTPDRWTLSLAGVIADKAILSADFELTNYKNMQLSDDNDQQWTNDQKSYISSDFKARGTLRLGAEYRFTPQFSGRIGYMWQQSPLQTAFRNQTEGNQLVTGGTIPHFTLDGDANYFTYGLGYRFSKSFYTDVAFVMKSMKSDLYPYSNLFYNDANNTTYNFGVVPTKMTANTVSGLLTVGFRF